VQPFLWHVELEPMTLLMRCMFKDDFHPKHFFQFASTVGSGVLTIKKACILASIFEFSGAFLMGSHTADTIRKGIVKTEVWEDHPEELMIGMLCALLGAGIWLAIASKVKMPGDDR
jgi:phosphate/sulfate permease